MYIAFTTLLAMCGIVRCAFVHGVGEKNNPETIAHYMEGNAKLSRSFSPEVIE